LLRWKTNINRFIEIDTKISTNKKTAYDNKNKIDEAESWLGIG
jgi:hypothetical protein